MKMFAILLLPLLSNTASGTAALSCRRWHLPPVSIPVLQPWDAAVPPQLLLHHPLTHQLPGDLLQGELVPLWHFWLLRGQGGLVVKLDPCAAQVVVLAGSRPGEHRNKKGKAGIVRSQECQMLCSTAPGSRKSPGKRQSNRLAHQAPARPHQLLCAHSKELKSYCSTSSTSNWMWRAL